MKLLTKLKRLNIAKIIRRLPIGEDFKNKVIAFLYYYFNLKPHTLTIDTVSKCNAKCPFCPHSIIGIKGDFINKDLFYKTVDEAKAIGIKECRLYSTGEPLMHPNIDEFISYLKKQDFFIILSTNAEYLDKHFEAASRVDWIKFSIEGWDKDSYEYYRKNCNFDKVKANIENFNKFLKSKATKPLTSIQIMINKETNLKQFLDLWGGFVDRIDYSVTGHMIQWNKENKIERLEFEGRLKDNMWNFHEKEGYKYCSSPFEEIVVSSKGNAILCCNDFGNFTKMIDLKENSLNDFLGSREREIMKKQFITQRLSMCDGCGIFEELTEESKIGYIDKLNGAK